MKVKPTRAGDVIRDPHTRRPVPADGGNVPDNSFWRRRLISGDVVLIEETPSGLHVDRRPGELAPHVDQPAHGHEGGEARGTPSGLEPVRPLTTRKP